MSSYTLPDADRYTDKPVWVRGVGLGVEERETFVGGRLPVNPSSGLKAKGHPPGATGVAQCVEIVEQLRGESTNQVDGRRSDSPTTSADRRPCRRSRSANVLFTLELERRFGERGVHTFAAHPGVVTTDLGRYGGAYLENCQRSDAVAAHARDPEDAGRLWTMSEELVG